MLHAQFPSLSPRYHRETKRGHKCCGYCCDARRAVIIVNIFSIIILVLIVSVIHASVNQIKDNPDEYDNDDKQKDQLENNNWAVLYGIRFAFLVIFMGGIVGAIRYNIYMIGLTGLLYILIFIVEIFLVLAASLAAMLMALVAAFFLYPHVVLVQEIRTGIMTPDSYRVREKYSCCCV